MKMRIKMKSSFHVLLASIAALLLVPATACGNGDEEEGAKSPEMVLSGNIVPVHDPAIILDDSGAHLFSTSHAGEGPGLIHWRTSPNLTDWTLRSAVFEELPAWAVAFNPDTRGTWAPDIVKAGDEYRIYYSISSFGQNTSAIGLATASVLDPDAENVWQDQGMVFSSEPSDDYNAIDPNIVIDDEGRHWMSFGSFWGGIKMIELDPQTGKALGDDPKIYDIASCGAPPNAIEAPFIVKRGEYYYMFVSKDFCCRRADSTYYTVVGRAKHPTGPYEGPDRSLMNDGGLTVLHADLDPVGRFVGPGHPAILQVEDDYLIVYHAYDTENEGAPTLRIQRLDWTEGGWPVAQ